MIKTTIQKMGFLLFMIGSAGMDSQNVTVPTTMVLMGLSIIGVTALLERRKHGKANVNSQRYFRDVQYLRKHGVQNNKAA